MRGDVERASQRSARQEGRRRRAEGERQQRARAHLCRQWVGRGVGLLRVWVVRLDEPVVLKGSDSRGERRGSRARGGWPRQLELFPSALPSRTTARVADLAARETKQEQAGKKGWEGRTGGLDVLAAGADRQVQDFPRRRVLLPRERQIAVLGDGGRRVGRGACAGWRRPAGGGRQRLGRWGRAVGDRTPADGGSSAGRGRACAAGGGGGGRPCRREGERADRPAGAARARQCGLHGCVLSSSEEGRREGRRGRGQAGPSSMAARRRRTRPDPSLDCARPDRAESSGVARFVSESRTDRDPLSDRSRVLLSRSEDCRALGLPSYS